MAKLKISIIVIVFRMPRQALNTLYSLSRQHQQNNQNIDYEVIVVENESTQCLDRTIVEKLGSEFKYFRRQESSKSPVGAMNFALSQCTGSHICMMIDGARMVTPRILEYFHMAFRASKHALVAVPGYSIGWQDQHHSSNGAYNEDIEAALLEKTNWKKNGYRLFDISVLSGANINGVYNPYMECNCMATSRENFNELDGIDMSFQQPGGGSINLHLFRQLGLVAKNSPYFILASEGSFHQYHKGITTSPWDDLPDTLLSHRTELHSHWPNGFSSLTREPTPLGSINKNALEVLAFSNFKTMKRFIRLQKEKSPLWRDDKPDTPRWIKNDSLSATITY